MQKVRLILLMVEMKLFFKLISILYLVVMIVSCERPSLSKIICGDDKRYWEYVDESEKFPLYLLFEKNGKWLPFEQDDKGNLTQYYNPHVRYNESWSVVSDSVLYMGGDREGYTVQSYSDSCILLYKGGKVKIELRAIDNFQDFVRKSTKHYQERLDSIMNISYRIIVDSTDKQNNRLTVWGRNQNGEKMSIAYTVVEGDPIKLNKNDSIIKQKNWILVNRVTQDSVSLYCYSVTSRNCFLLKHISGLKKEFKPNRDGVLVPYSNLSSTKYKYLKNWR
jgi:hypothetical protein